MVKVALWRQLTTWRRDDVLLWALSRWHVTSKIVWRPLQRLYVLVAGVFGIMGWGIWKQHSYTHYWILVSCGFESLPEILDKLSWTRIWRLVNTLESSIWPHYVQTTQLLSWSTNAGFDESSLLCFDLANSSIPHWFCIFLVILFFLD